MAIHPPAFLVGPLGLVEGDVEADVVADRPVVLLRGADLAQQVGRIAEDVVASERLRAALAALLGDVGADVVEDEALPSR
jgi:hypothetical protein